MKLASYVIIALGLMFLLFTAGIDTGSSAIATSFGFSAPQNITVDGNPAVNSSSLTEGGLKGIVLTKTFWAVIGFIIIITLILSLTQFTSFLAGWKPDVRSGQVILSLSIWTLVSWDMFGVLSTIYSYQSGVGWVFMSSFLIIMIFLTGFAFAVIKFMNTGE